MDLKPYQYHPIRWELLRDAYEYRDFRDAYAEEDLGDAEISEAGGVERLDDIIQRESNTTLFMDAFEKAGSHIYHLEPALVRMLRHTSVYDVPIEVLTAPYETVFIYFGSEGEVRCPGDGRVVDGAYVMLSDETDGTRNLWIYLCPEFPDLASAKHMSQIARVREDEGYRWVILNSEAGTVGESHANLFKTYGERFSEFEHYRMEKALAEAGVTTRRRTYDEAKASRWIDPHDALWKGHDKEAVNLVVNALAFLTARPEDVEFGFRGDVPQSLAAKAEDRVHPKQARRAESKLEALGYRRVYTCGRRFRLSQAARPHDAPGMHWRRGHWRNQPHGPQHSLRKLIWVEPVLVNANDEALLGRVHK